MDLNHQPLGPEPSALTRLRYTPMWSPRPESNRLRPGLQSGASSLQPHGRKVVDGQGVEPRVFWSRARRVASYTSRQWWARRDLNVRLPPYQDGDLTN